MDRRCAAGALVALAACIATTAAAPTASNQTALDLYEGASEGCYYNFQHYGEGDRIMTNEPCLNCTCHNRMLMCYLRVCPFTKPIGQDCSVEKRADQCCPIVTCPDVPVDLLTSTSTSSPSEYGETGVGKLDRYGCSINGKYFPEGSKVPPSPNKPCEHCYCIRNMTTCVMQECTLHVDGCTPIYRKDVCCPVRYSCDHPEDEIPLLDDMTTTVRPTPGFLLTTTTLSPVTQMTQDCVHDEKIFADGALIKTEKACEHCYCMKGDIVCVVQECGTPMENEGKNCTSMPPREGQCCPDTYICEGDEQTTEIKPDVGTVTPIEDLTTISPPRRVSVEGSGYRSETDEPSTVGPIFEPDNEGSGEDQLPVNPTDIIGTLPESETYPPSITTAEDAITEKYWPKSTEHPESNEEMFEVTTEADKGENTVPSGDIDEDTSNASVKDTISPDIESTTTGLEAVTEPTGQMKTTTLPKDETSVKGVEDKTTTREEVTATESSIRDTTTHEEMPITDPGSTVDHDLNTSPDDKFTTETEIGETTLPSRRQENDEEILTEITTLKQYEESTTKAADLITPDSVIIESTTSSFKEDGEQTSSKTSDKESEVNERTTEANVELTTQSNIITPYTQSATTVQPEIVTEISTPSKVDLIDTTSANPIENEIDEESFPTLAPGRIPGEGDCLYEGVTYSHESIVPSNCKTSCRCISSIVKCEPIICSPPPDYMDNCQPMYDSSESCCPTYVCDHPKETVPPQSHSQMAGTESPIPTPTIECNGDQCEIVKEEVKPPVLCTSEGCTGGSSQTPDKTADCGVQGCGEIDTEPEKSHPSEPAGECTGDGCRTPPVQCASGNCETPIPKDQTCNSEHGCEIPVVQECQGDNCALQPDITAPKDDSTHCDNPDSCKIEQIPDKSSGCTGESCISESPSQTVPHDKQDCKDGDNCAQQTPSIEECKEDDCKRQQVPEIDRPAPSDCIGADCIQQDNVSQITNVPELSTESAPRVTELPEDSETKSKEPVTDLPNTTTRDAESSATTKVPISDNVEEVATTPLYEESGDNQEKEQTTTETLNIVPQTSEGQPEESKTEGYIHQETIMDELPEVTPGPSEAPKTEIPSLSDNVEKEATTEHSRFEVTQSPEPVTVIDDAQTTKPGKDAEDKNAVDITTAEPALPTTDSTSPEIKQETTIPSEILTQAPETLDRDGQETTKEPEYIQDTEAKVTEPTERFTSDQEQVTDKLDVEPVQEQEPHEVPTTSKSYDSTTNIPESLETEVPMKEVSHSSTLVPEIPTTPSQKESELPVSVSTSDEPITDKPDHTVQTEEMEAPVSGSDDRTTAKPDIARDGSETQSPELNRTPDEESITKAPVRDITDDSQSQTEQSIPLVTLPQDMVTKKSDVDETPLSFTVNVETQTPMSIVKEHDDNDISSTITPESGTTTEHDETITKEPKSPEPEQVTEFAAKPTEISSEKPVSDLEKMPSESEIEHDAATTEKPIADLETKLPEVSGPEIPTKEPVHDTDVTTIPKTETSTDSVPISTEMASLGPSVTEAIQELGPQQEFTSESAPITSVPTDDIETKSPDTVTVSSVQTSSEGIETITSVQTNEDTDVTELPELVIHEHPTEPTDKITTNLPDITDKEAHNIIPDEDTSLTTPEDTVTIAPEVSTSKTQKETTEQEFATQSPEKAQSETTESKLDDNVSYTPESYTTMSQKVTEIPESQTLATKAPEIATTEAPKEVTDVPATQVTTEPKISVTEPQEVVTEGLESQYTVTDADAIVTQPHRDTTEVFESDGIVTNAPDTIKEPHKVTTEIPEESEAEEKGTTKIYDITTTAPELSPTERESSPVESDKEATESPISQEVTSVPKLSATEPEEETTTPKPQESATSVSETEEADQKLETTPATQDRVTSIPEISTTESVSIKDTHIPVVQEEASTVPAISVMEPEQQTTETPARDDTATFIPAVHATEPEHDATEGPADSVTKIPENLTTDSDKDAQAPETQDTETNAPEIAETEPKKDMTIAPETGSAIPEIAQTEPNQVVTDVPIIQVYTDAPALSDDSKTPETIATVSQGVVTDAPETHDMVTNAELSTKSDERVTEIPEKAITESHTVPTQPSESLNTAADKLTTEPQREVTEIPEISHTMGTNAPEILTTKSDKDVTEMSEEVLTTETPELSQTKTPPAVETDGSSTEASLKITTEFDSPTQSDLQDLVTPTEPSHDTRPTIGELPVEQDDLIPVTELPASESPDKITDSDSDIEKPTTGIAPTQKKPEEGSQINTEVPTEEPIKTDSTIPPQLIESEKSPESIAPETSTTVAPESSMTEKEDHTQPPEDDTRRTEVTSAPIDEISVTKASEIESQDEMTTTSEELKQTTESKQNEEEHPETTPYLVLLEEHTHKTVSPDEEITASSSEVPQKEYEPSTPSSVSIGQVTESVPVMETEKSTSDKDQSVTELAQTTISDGITTISPSSESVDTEKPQNVETNEISTSAPMTNEKPIETEKPSVSSAEDETEKEVVTSEKPSQTNAPEDFILATSKSTTIKAEEESTTLTPLLDKFGKPDEEPQPTAEIEKPKPDTADEASKPGTNDVQPTDEAIQPEEDSHFPPSGTSGYGQEPDYGEEDSFGPGTCRYGGKVYVSAQQIPRDDPCDFCFCFRSDIICLQQSCPPPIHGCHEEPIQGFCCPRYECPVSMATTLNVTTTTTTTTTTLPPHFLPHAYKGAAQRRGCQIKGHTYKVGEVVRASSGPCLHCTCGGDGQMKCDPKVCTPEPMLRQMIAAAVSAKRRR